MQLASVLPIGWSEERHRQYTTEVRRGQEKGGGGRRRSQGECTAVWQQRPISTDMELTAGAAA